MKTVDEPTTQYIDAAIERMEAGLDRRIRKHRARTVAILAGAAAAAVIIAGGGVLALRPSAPISPPQALGHHPLSAADISSWTSVPQPGLQVSDIVSACSAQFANEPLIVGSPRVISSDLRGRVQSVIVAQSGYEAYCIGAGVSTDAMVLLDAPQFTPPKVTADSITLGPSGANTAANGWAFAAGTAGSGVSAITLHESGLDIVATVAHGTWMAWWPTHNFHGVIGGTFTITHTDGTVTTSTADQIHVG